MPKLVDHELRREQITDALMSVTAAYGLEAASLRQVASEAGVSVGMVQHYFPSKHRMIIFAMTRVRQDLRTRVLARATDHRPRSLARALLVELTTGESSARELRIVLAFLAYGVVHADTTGEMRDGAVATRVRMARLIRAENSWGENSRADAERVAITLFALVEGLARHVNMGGCPTELATATLQAHLDIAFGPERAPAARAIGS